MVKVMPQRGGSRRALPRQSRSCGVARAARRERLLAGLGFIVGRDENDRRPLAGSDEPTLQLDARDAAELHVEHEAIERRMRLILEKRRRRRIGHRLHPDRAQQPAE
jgi:hypothetical protein